MSTPNMADNAREIIGKSIKERRNAIGYTQASLAALAGIRNATLIDVEAGKPYKMDTLLSILSCLRGELQIKWDDDCIPW